MNSHLDFWIWGKRFSKCKNLGLEKNRRDQVKKIREGKSKGEKCIIIICVGHRPLKKRI